MLENILHFDKELFLFLNKTISFSVLNNFFIVFTDLNKIYFVKLILFISILYIITLGTKKSKFVLLIVVIGIVFTDQISSQFLKNYFQRLRPCFELENINLLVSCGGGFSFPSSHAANSFSVAYLLAMFYKNFKNYYYFLAILISYSRIYVGVHYPIDIIIGAILGIIISYILFKLFKRFFVNTYSIVISN